MKSGKWDARANKMPIFYGQPRDERLAGWQVWICIRECRFPTKVERFLN